MRVLTAVKKILKKFSVFETPFISASLEISAKAKDIDNSVPLKIGSVFFKLSARATLGIAKQLGQVFLREKRFLTVL